MEFGVHLPLIGFDDRPFTLDRLIGVARAAVDAGYTTIAANDHLLFSRAWLDGPTALAAILEHSANLDLMTTVALPVVRGPAPLAKTLGSLDALSGGRVIAGVGPGSSPRDYEAVSISFDERWKRLDESIQALRVLLGGAEGPYTGTFYSAAGPLEPRAPRPGGPPIWIGSWGSDAGLRRVARLADGWLASAYNTTAEEFERNRGKLDDVLKAHGKDPGEFPDALATTLMYLTVNEQEAESLLRDRVCPALNRPYEQIHERLLICTAEEARRRVQRYQEAGLQRMLIWPIADEESQVRRFAGEVKAALLV